MPESKLTTSALVPQVFEGHSVRVEIIDGDPWFSARDVGACLGLKPTGARDAVRALDADQRAGVVSSDTSSNGTTQRRKATYVSESGLYAMTMQSRKPQARRFQKWVTGEVLPSIRKTGSYSATPPQTLMERSAALVLELTAEVEKEHAARLLAEGDVIVLGEEIEEMRPAAEAWRDFSSGEMDLINTGDAFALAGVTLNRKMWAFLESWVFVVTDYRRWRKKYVKMGWGRDHAQTVSFGGKQRRILTPKWTARGVGVLHEKLRLLNRQRRFKP